MRAVLTLTAIGSALWVAASSAQAIGFGRISNPTQLGQPLNFSAVVRLEADEALPAECVSAEVQSGDNRLAPGQVRVSVDGPPEAGERTVRVTTSALIDEPVVTVSVTVGCQAKVTRRFVAFVDPPLINAPQTAFTEPVPPRAEPQTATIVNAVPRSAAVAPRQRTADDAPRDAAAPRSRPRASAPVTVSRAARDGITPQAARPRSTPAAPRQPNTTARATTSGPRLQLETAAPVIARAGSAPAAPVIAVAPSPVPAAASASIAASLAVADAASAVKADSPVEQLAAERQRIQALEENMAKLAKNSQATQASLLALQARLKDAESERFANPLVYLLAGLVALLALLVALLFWRQSRGTRPAQWWSGPVPTPAPSDAPLTVAPADAVPVPVPAPLVAAVAADEAPASTHTATDVFDNVPTFPQQDEPPAPEAVVPPRELSVEELMDLEQQAEFFIVLGQDDAAIELLMSHVRTDGGNSPLPYLKLLEIHHRLGDTAAYERIRERFNRRFNAYAPDFEADPQDGRSLADYPETIERLQSLWSAPTRVMQTLDASLFRRNKGDATFDLPAYRELLFLYAVARDLAESVGVPPSTGVDLLLPFEDSAEEPVARLNATPGAPISEYADTATLPVDLNLASNQAAATPEPGRGDAAQPGFIDFHLDLPDLPPEPDKPSRR